MVHVNSNSQLQGQMATDPLGMLWQNHARQNATRYLKGIAYERLDEQLLGQVLAALERSRSFCAPLAPAFRAVVGSQGRYLVEGRTSRGNTQVAVSMLEGERLP